jgi:hypothetical protein
MAQIQYSASTGASYVTSTTAVQTALAIVNAATDCGVQLKRYRIGFNGVTASNSPVLCRFFSTNNATAGTSTASTISQESGRTLAIANITCASMYTVEPTTKTYFGDGFSLTPNGGTVIYDFPLGDEPDIGISSTFGLEILATVAVGVQASFWFTRI